MKNFGLNLIRAVSVAAMLITSSLTMVSCSESGKSNTEKDKSLEVTPKVVSVPCEGGEQLLELKSNGVSWTAMSSEEWLHISPSDGSSDASVKVTIDENKETSSRMATITFAGSGVSNVNVDVVQDAGKPKDVNKTMTYAEYYYYGDYYKTDGKFSSVVLLLTDGIVLPAGLQYPCEIVQLTLNLNNVSFKNVDITGKYKVADGAPAEDHTILISGSSTGYYNDPKKPIYTHKPVSGEAEITKDGTSYNVKFTLTLDDGSKYTGAYNGIVTSLNNTVQSTLTEDFRPARTTKAEVNFQVLPESEGYKYDVVTLDLVGKNDKQNYDDMMLMFFVDKTAKNTKNIVGEYKVDSKYETREPADILKNSAIPGSVSTQDGSTNFIGCWYLETDETLGTIVGNKAPAVDGTISISKNNDDYTIEYEFIDDAGYTVKGVYVGKVDFK